MTVGLLKIHIHLHGVHSLKEKRRIVKSLIERLKSRYNVSAAEVAANDSKQLAVIGIAVVSNDGGFLDRSLDTIISFIRADGRFILGQVERQAFPFNE